MAQQKQKAVNVAVLGSMPPLRGLSSYCLELSNAISHLCNVEVLSFKSIYPSFLYPGGQLKDDHTFPVVSQDRLIVKKKLTWYNPLTWLIAGLFTKADILHAQWWSLPLLPVYFVICLFFKLRKKPVVFTIHNVLPHEWRILYLAFTRFLFKLSDHFIVHTNHNVEQLKNQYKISKLKISCIAHGTLDFQVQKQINRSAIRQEMGFGENHKIILFFGAIRPYKGLDTLMKSLSTVLETVPETRLLIAGKLWEKWQPYSALAKSLEINDFMTTYLDYVPSGDVFKYFESSDLVVLPYHRFDSQSGIGTTAIAFRKPLIVTHVGGLPDLVSDSRYSVPPKDTEALTKAIVHCLSNPHQMEEMSLSADEIAKDLSWTTIAKKTCDVYHRILENK
jgi:glycosyltransferase involved in cell wall biosynthesis